MKQPDILIVDDEQRYADMLAKRLEMRGLQCSVCYNGQTAIDMIIRQHYSLVVLDLQLPDLYGIDVLTEIKKCRKETTVVILTGHGSAQDRSKCLAEGAYAFMNKPLQIDRLVAIMSELETSANEGTDK